MDIAATATGDGYWTLGARGGMFAYGDATVHGDVSGLSLNERVTGLVPDPDCTGY